MVVMNKLFFDKRPRFALITAGVLLQALRVINLEKKIKIREGFNCCEQMGPYNEAFYQILITAGLWKDEARKLGLTTNWRDLGDKKT